MRETWTWSHNFASQVWFPPPPQLYMIETWTCNSKLYRWHHGDWYQRHASHGDFFAVLMFWVWFYDRFKFQHYFIIYGKDGKEVGLTILQCEFKPLAPPVFTNKSTWITRAHPKVGGVEEEEKKKDKKSICWPTVPPLGTVGKNRFKPPFGAFQIPIPILVFKNGL